MKEIDFSSDMALHYALLAVCATTVISCLYKALRSWADVVKLGQHEHAITRGVIDPLVQRYMIKGSVGVHEVRMRLQQAGMRDEAAVQRYNRWRVSLRIGALGFVAVLLAGRADLTTLVMDSGFCVAVAFLGPDLYIDRTRRDRQQQIDAALPSLMDLMVLCLDVGLSVEAAFDRVTSEMRSLHPLMAEEASVMGSEIAAGLTFPRALSRMAERIGTEDLLTLARLIAQASQLGASVATALREYSEQAMSKRILRLEEKAGKIGSMMTMPIVVCLLPAMMIALLGPSIIDLIGTFSQV